MKFLNNRAKMTMKIWFICVIVLVVFLVNISCSKAGTATNTGEIVSGIPVKNTVTLVDLGASACIPCKLMAPILDELKEEYKGRAAVIFIDVREKANKEKAVVFNVRVIPTQIFFDKTGQEVYRHVGFLEKDKIVSKLEELLAD